jgi:AraC family transcriptional regulator
MSYKFSEVKIEELPPQRVICCRAISNEPEEEVINRAQAWLAQHGLSADGRRNFGFDVPVSVAEAAAGIRGYEIGYTVPDDIQADNGMLMRTYGGGQYAVLRVYNAFAIPFEAIPGGWKALIAWIKESPDWDFVHNLCYEELVQGEDGMDLILYQAVRK